MVLVIGALTEEKHCYMQCVWSIRPAKRCVSRVIEGTGVREKQPKMSKPRAGGRGFDGDKPMHCNMDSMNTIRSGVGIFVLRDKKEGRREAPIPNLVQ